MSLVADTHRAHLERQARLGLLPAPRPRLTRAQLQALPPPVTKAEKWGAPVTLIGLPGSKTVIRLVSLKHGTSVADLTGPSKTIPLVKARDEAVSLIYTHCRYLSLPYIARMFGRHHTTVLHTLRKLRLTGMPAYRWGKLQAPGKNKTPVDAATLTYSMGDRQPNREAIQ